MKNVLPKAFLCLLAIVSLVPSVSAAMPSIYGADIVEKTVAVSPDKVFPDGLPFSSFNNYKDNAKMCMESGWIANGGCSDYRYADEKQFVRVIKTNSDGSIPQDGKYGLDVTNTLKEGDELEVMLYVHNNARTIVDKTHTAKNVKAAVTLEGNKVVGSITATNAFDRFPSTSEINAVNSSDTISISDTANIALPAGYKLEFFENSKGYIRSGVQYCASADGISCKSSQVIQPSQGASGKFALAGNTYTYNHGDQVGSQAYKFNFLVHLKVVKDDSKNTTPTASRFGQCTSNDTYKVKFDWSDQASKVEVTDTEDNSTYTKSVSASDHSTIGPEGFTGLDTFYVGTAYTWRVLTDKGWKQGNDFSFDCDDYDNGFRSTLNQCIDQSNYQALLSWTFTRPETKVQISTNKRFATSFEKNAGNVNKTLVPDGMTGLQLQNNVRYYWRVWDGSQWIRGKSFSYDCRDSNNNTNNNQYVCGNLIPEPGEECDDGGYTGDFDACTSDCKLIKRPDEIECTTCGCVDVNVTPAVAGDYNKATFEVEVENKTKNATVAKTLNLRNVKADLQTLGVTRLASNGGGEINEGDFILTDVRYETIPDNQGMRKTSPGSVNYPITVKGDQQLVSNRLANVTIENLYQGDKVKFYLTGIARTSYPGHELKKDTNNVNYLLTMNTETNGGSAALLITRPFLLTFNDGDILSSAVVTGLANLVQVAREATGDDFLGNYSGYFLEQAKKAVVGNNNTGIDAKLSVNVDSKELAQQVEKTLETFNAGNTAVSNTSTIMVRQESDFGRTNGGFTQRPDGSRVYLAKGSATVAGQRVEIGTASSSVPLQLKEQSTVVIENRDLYIHSDIIYDDSGKTTPSIAFVVKGGNIYIDPRVKHLDGIFIALDEGGKISGTSDWQTYYNAGNQPVNLEVRGALYGDLAGLFESRPNAKDPTTVSSLKDSAGVTVDFDGRIYSATPPGLKEIIGQTFEKLR